MRNNIPGQGGIDARASPRRCAGGDVEGENREEERMETNRLMKAVVALAWLAIAAPAAALELRLAHSADTSHPHHIPFHAMTKRVAERSKGAVLIKIFPANALGSPPDQAEQGRLGVLDR